MTLEQTLEQVQQVEQRVREGLEPGEARSVVSLAGVQFTDIEPLFGDQFGQVLVSLESGQWRPHGSGHHSDGMREKVLATPIDGKIAFLQISGGPPTQLPVNVKVRSDDFDELDRATERMRRLIAGIEGTRDISDDRVPGRSELVLSLDREALAQAGLGPDTLGRLLRLHVDGEVVGFTRDSGDRFELRVKADRRPGIDPAGILEDPVLLPNGQTSYLGGPG